LIGFKYLGFLSGTINSLLGFVSELPVFKIEKLFLPLGISYIIFKYISYLTDIHWGIVKKGHWLDFACYGSLFTIFVAGPIERFERLKPQLEAEAEPFKLAYLDTAFQRIVFGLFKKLVLADWLGYFIQPVWQNPDQYSTFIRIGALFGYSLQIYFDFAGYSDIAIGSSKLLGLKIMENFNNPYFAPNISQFWRRWHISLSDWIKDYLFFPLSQNKQSMFWLIFCVPVIAMALCGLWHGAAWHYVIWGVWHGVGISLLQSWNMFKRANKKKLSFVNKPWFSYLSIVITFVYVTMGWWWFR
jgi:alginate O-acetyltransferase complex protein AlgI